MATDVQSRASSESPATHLDIRATARALLQQKWVVLSVFVTVIAATIFGTLSLPKVYEASTTLEYDPSPPRPLGKEVEDVASPVGNFLAGKEWYQTQNAIIRSRTIAKKVVERLALNRDPDFMKVREDERASWKGVDVDTAADKLLDVMTVRQERDTRVARISVENGNPERAALLANAVAAAYMDWVMEERLGSTVRAVEWLSGQLDEVSGRLEKSEHALYDFRRSNNVLSVSLADQQNGVVQTMHSFSAALTEATTRRIQVQAKLRQFEAALRDDPMQVHAAEVAESKDVSELRRRYHEAISKRDSLAATYGANHPEMRKINAEIETLVAAARKEILGLVEALRGELREVQEVETGIQQAKQQTQNAGLDLNLHEIEYNRLERERANNEKIHGLLLQRTTETNLTRLLRVSPVRLVDRAAVPTRPIRPRPVLNLALGAVAGLLGGLGFAFLRMRMDRSVSSPEDVTAIGVTVLGLVPGILNDRGTPEATQYGRKRARRQSATDQAASKDLVVHTHPHSSVAECCRTIRTNLAFMSTDKPLKAIVVTSPGPAEGKSTLAMSLAITMAHSGRRVLLVDTDLRRPRIHRAFGLPHRIGITSVLAGEQNLEDCVQKTMVDGLSVLPCGPIPPTPSELLHTATFARILEELKARFDLVILDSPPVGVVIDAAIIGPQVDGVILVAESGRTSRDALAHAVRQMRDVGTKILGGVLNGVDLSTQGSYGGQYYYTGGYYYSSPEKGSDDGPEGPSANSSSEASYSPQPKST